MQQKSPSSCNRPEMKYDVFISFRGKDVRKNFVGFLHRELERLGLKAFLDEKEFKIGDDLYELFKIIEESKFVIVVLSKDYASSKWCLRELTKIMDSSMETTRAARVLPVFYRVEPSEIRHPSNPFLKKKFVKFKSVLKGVDDGEKQKKLEEIKRWKKAMKEISTRTGVVITKTSSQVDVVEKIARQIFDTISEESTQETTVAAQIFNTTSKKSTQEIMVEEQVFNTTLEESTQETIVSGEMFDSTTNESTQETMVGEQIYDMTLDV